MLTPKPTAKAREKRGQRGRTHDFSEEYLGRDVVVKLSTGEEVRGRLVEATKYWFKVLVGDPARPEDVIYVNKAYVAYVRPGRS
jgi:hypothetical protein